VIDAPVGPLEAAASVVLVAVAVGLSIWQRLGVERSILWACLRAAVQLLAVGYLLRVVFDAPVAELWAWLWVVAMVLVAADVARRRAMTIPRLRWITILAVGLSTGVTLLVLFGLGVFDVEPVTVVVMAGITIGNAMPSVVLGIDRTASTFRDRIGHVEELLALGFDRTGLLRVMLPPVVRTALIPQIERTKVVGLIALPGAMTGLLLAGVDPVDAVLVQLVVMYLVLGAGVVSVVTVRLAVARTALTIDLRTAPWVREHAPGS
jgi:UDP-glucose/iron transport system permease protein